MRWFELKLILKHLTIRKIWNYCLLFGSFYVSKFFRRAIHFGDPVSVGIEPTNLCNLRCPECPSGLRSFTRPTGMLEPALFQQLLDEISPNLLYLLLYFQGEPYLNPHFLGLVRYAVSKNVITTTSTNGHFLDDKRAQETVASGLHRLIISLDGLTQESYQQYRVGGNLQKVIAGIQNLAAWKQKLRSKTPYILLQFIVFKANEHEIDAVNVLAKQLNVDAVLIKTAQIYDYENGNPLIPTQEKYSRYKKLSNGKYQIKNTLENQCWKLWQGLEITWDGKLLPCCFDKDAAYVMGTFPEQSTKTIWRSSQYQTFREKILSGRKNIPMCQNCTEGTKVFE